MKLFNERFINKLNCPYILGRFNSYGSEYFEYGNAFSVALFEKTEDEIVTFVVDFLAEAHISGAAIKTDIFKVTFVKIQKMLDI